jgi:ATP-dependent RNA helicase DDX3X
MSTAYIPPHLRGKGVEPRIAQKSASEAIEESRRSPRFPQSTRRQFTRNKGMSRSISTPSRLSELTDKQIEEMFAKNTISPDFEVYESVKVNVHSAEKIEPCEQFVGSGVSNELLANIANMGYKVPTTVQKYSFAYILAGKDLIVTSQTGSGKTAAFMLPVITQLLNRDIPFSPTVVVLAPTRELALQIQEHTDKFTHGTHIRTICVYGGTPIYQQLRELNYACHILIATPGRLIDILKRGNLTLSCVQFLILDEADRMLDMGFEPQIREVIEGYDMPPSGSRQTLLFSATFPREVQNLALSYMKKDMTRIEVGLQDAPTLIDQNFEYSPDHSKMSALIDALNKVDGPTLVFAERKQYVDRIEDYLYDEGCAVVAIHGDRDMRDRLAALNAFTNGRARIMVATDVAARGIDIPNVAHVINLDLPTDLDSYIHRIGRTGRAGNRGIATSFWNENNERFLEVLIVHYNQTKQPIPEGLEEFAEQMNSRRQPQSGRGRRGRGGRGGFPRDRSYQNFSRY